MSTTSVKIDLKYKEDTFENTKLNYQWINSCIEKLGIIEKEVRFRYSFSYGAYRNDGETYKEFIDEAFDKTDFSLNSMTWYCNKVYISLSFFRGISISSSDKNIVHDLVNLLQQPDDNEKNFTNIYNAPVISGNGNTIATDNANIIQGNNNTLHNQTEQKTKQESKLKIFFKAVATNICSNYIYYMLGALEVILLSYFSR